MRRVINQHHDAQILKRVYMLLDSRHGVKPIDQQLRLFTIRLLSIENP